MRYNRTTKEVVVHQVYSQPGSSECLLLNPYDVGEQRRLLSAAERILCARGEDFAAGLIYELHFSIWRATNTWADDFSVLVGTGSPEEYARWVDQFTRSSNRPAFASLAAAVSEVLKDSHIRIIGFDVAIEDEYPLVRIPTTGDLANEVVRAFSDADILLRNQGPASAIDRIHTAVHAYFRQLCTDRALAAPEGSLTSLFKRLREDPGVLGTAGARSDDLNRIIEALSAIADAGNRIRNKASLAHPNPALEAAEARLTINSLRTLFVFVQDKVNGYRP